MAGRPGLIGVSVLVLAEEEHLQGFDLVLPKVGVNPAKDQAWRTKTATLKSAQSMVHGRIGRRGAVAVAVVEEESPQERAPVPRRSLGASLAQERA